MNFCAWSCRRATVAAWVVTAVALMQPGYPAPGDSTAARRTILKLQGHEDSITALAYSPDGKLLASADREGRVCVWNAASGEQLHRLDAHKGGTYALVFSPDGKNLGSAGQDGLIRWWDVARGQALRQLEGHRGAIPSIAVSPNGKTLASGGYDGTIRLWDIATGKQRSQWHAHKERVTAVAYTSDGKALLSGGTHDWDYVAGGNNVIHCARADHIHVWETDTGKLTSKLGIRGFSATLSPDKHTLAAGETGPDIQERNGGVSINGFDQFSLLDRLTGEAHEKKWRGCATVFSPDGQVMVSGYGFPPPGCGLTPASPGPDARKLVDTRIQFWEMLTGKEILQFPEERARALAFSPDGKSLASGNSSGTVLLWLLPCWDDATPARDKDLTESELVKIWEQLADPDAKTACKATWRLTAAPASSIKLFKERLRADPPVDGKRIRQWLSELDAERFAVREAASADLQKLGTAALPALRLALSEPKSAEARRRLLALLAELKGKSPTPEQMRQSRSIQVLERIGTKEVQEILESLTSDPPLTWQASTVAAALERLQRRSR